MKKLEKINISQNKIESQLNEKQNKYKNLLIDDYNWKKTNIIKETDWLSGSPLSLYGRVTSPNQYVSATLNTNQTLDFTLDRKFLPFVTIDVIVKNSNGLEFVGFYNYNREIYEGDYIEVYGDEANLIYRGPAFFTNGLLSQAFLDAGRFQEEFTKTHYIGTIYYTRDGSEWLISPLDNTVSISQMTIYYDTAIHHGVEYQTSFVSDIISISAPTNTDKIVKINDDLIKLKGTLREWMDTSAVYTYVGAFADQWFSTPNIPSDGNDSIISVTVDGNPVSWEFMALNSVRPIPHTVGGETVVITYNYLISIDTPNQEITKSWIDINDFEFNQSNSRLYKKIGTDYILQSGISSFDTHASDTLVTNKVFTFYGYWLYYDDNTIDKFIITDAFPIVNEGSFHKKILSNLPVDTDPPTNNPPHRKWNTIRIRRNTDPHPLSQVEFPVSDYGDKEYIFIRKFQSIDNLKESYRLMLQGNLVFKVLADNTSSSPIYPVYNYLYIKDATSYVASHSFSTKTATYYSPSSLPNVEYKIQISLINPYEFSDRKNYNA